MVKFCIGAGVLTAMGMLAGAVRADGTSADAVVEYVPGTISSASLQKSGAAAIGLPASVDDGQTSPFSPPFHATAITIVGAGGDIVLHFAQPVLPTAGPDIGVFTNTGLVAASVGGVITAATASDGSAATLGMKDTAIVSVSADDSTWVALNGGNALDLTMPSNAFLDGTFAGGTVSGGTLPANPYQPFAGTLTSFAGLTYPQMVGVLGGSFGGAWIDASTSGLPVINYIRFDVPTGDRLVLDAVTGANAVPEPGTLAMLAFGAGIFLTRRKKSRSARSGIFSVQQETIEPQLGNAIVHSFSRESHSMKTISAIVLTSALLAAASSTASALQISDNFATNPIGTRATTTGDASRFSYDPASQTVIANYNSALPTAKLLFPLNTVINQNDPFTLSTTFTINSITNFDHPDSGDPLSMLGTAQISFGLANSVTTGDNRTDGFAGDAYDLVTADYFPTNNQFGAPNLGVTVVESAEAGHFYYEKVDFPSAADSTLPGFLSTSVPITAQISYDPTTHILTSSFSASPLTDAGTTSFTSTQDLDVTSLAYDSDGFQGFNVDSFALTLWDDSSAISQGYDVPVSAQLAFQDFSLTVGSPVPEPASLAVWMIGGALLIKRRSRRGAL
jgi:hypothetical protein